MKPRICKCLTTLKIDGASLTAPGEVQRDKRWLESFLTLLPPCPPLPSLPVLQDAVMLRGLVRSRFFLRQWWGKSKQELRDDSDVEPGPTGARAVSVGGYGGPVTLPGGQR